MRRLGNNERLAGVVALIAAIIFAGIAATTAVQNAALGRGSPTATATILEVHEAKASRGSDSYVVVRFEADNGDVVVAEVHDFVWTPRPAVGGIATVRYSRSDPAGRVRDVRMGDNVWGVLLPLAAAAGFAWVGVPTVRRGRLPRWTRRL